MSGWVLQLYGWSRDSARAAFQMQRVGCVSSLIAPHISTGTDLHPSRKQTSKKKLQYFSSAANMARTIIGDVNV